MKAILLQATSGKATFPEPLLVGETCGARPPCASLVPRYGAAPLPCPCGGAVTYVRAPTEQSDSAYYCTVCHREIPDNEALPLEWRSGEQGGHDYSRKALALVLAWEGQPVSLGMGRAMDLLRKKDINRKCLPFDGALHAGAVWCPIDMHANEWKLLLDGSMAVLQCYRGERLFDTDIVVRALLTRPADLPIALRAPWSLAVCCEARGFGTAVIVAAAEAR